MMVDLGIESIVCPSCDTTFRSPTSLARHLNDPQQSCSLIGSEKIPYPIPAALYAHQEEEVTGHYYESSGCVFSKGPTLLDKMKDDEYEQRREHVMHYPFQDDAEWELAKFLARNLTKTSIDEFLKLKWFDTHSRPSFPSGDHLWAWLDRLPSGPEWQCTTMTVTGVTTAQPIRLFWRDAKEVVEDLLSNPIFANHMMFDPHIVIRNGQREYGEFFSGNRAHHIQDQIDKGATLVPIIIASDKTPVTRHTGGLEMHPVFITIGNIQSDVRMQATSHAWRCVGYIPSLEFDVHSEFQTLLSARLFHSCMDIIFASLKKSAAEGAAMTDAFGYVRNCFTPLVAYVADLPEQQLIAGVAKNASPVTTTTLIHFGDSHPHNPRHARDTLAKIEALCAAVDPWDIATFQKKAKAENLLGVHLPFWRDWRFADPAYFLNGELLHTCHKFFFDHPLKWCKEAAGSHLLDERYKNQHRRVGVHHFSNGVSHVKQMTGRDHRDIQHTIVPMIAQATSTASPLFVRCIRSLVDFIYRAQSPIHTDSSLSEMVATLHDFHLTKHSIIEAEARRGASGVKADFNIPKLELLQSFARNISTNGTLHQYSADVSEHLLITHCKAPFERTSRRGDSFVHEVIGLLNCLENMRRFDLYHILRSSTLPLEAAVVQEDNEVAGIDPTLSFVSRIAPQEERIVKGPRPFHNHFTNPKGFLSADGAVVFHVTVKPDCAGVTITEMQQTHCLPSLTEYLTAYITTESGEHAPQIPPPAKINVWNKFRIQQHSPFRSHYITKSQLIQAYPPSSLQPFGIRDVVFLGCRDMNYVARVMAIFSFQSQHNLPPCVTVPLLFVEYFNIVAGPNDDREGVGMYRVQRPLPAEHPSIFYAVVPLTSIVHALELVPVYSTRRQEIALSSETCLDAFQQYYINTFADKETYHVLHSIT